MNDISTMVLYISWTKNYMFDQIMPRLWIQDQE